jgi:hypothetical protein
MPKAMRGRPRKLNGSPRTEALREKERARRQEQRTRKALGQSRQRGRPSKRGAAPEATKPDLVADQVAEPDNLSRSSSLNYRAKRSKTPAAQRARHKPLKPDGNPDSPQPPATSRMAVRALAICTAPALEPQVAAEELCVICKQDKLDCPAGVRLPRYLPCCTSRIHTTCLASWRTSSVQKNGQMMANAHNCPTCMFNLVGTRDLRDEGHSRQHVFAVAGTRATTCSSRSPPSAEECCDSFTRSTAVQVEASRGPEHVKRIHFTWSRPLGLARSAIAPRRARLWPRSPPK